MAGGAGDDYYNLDTAADRVIEAAGGGTDWVEIAAAAYTLGANVENLEMRTQSAKATGNALANEIETGIYDDTLYGLGAGVWSRDANTCYRMGRAIKAGRVWTNCYHAYPAHAAFGGYKQSGIGRETHRMMLDHYQQTKNMLVSYSPKKLGFF
jgi:hypothetical protein